MLRFILRIVLTATAFMFVLPMIPGITFHGGFGFALGAALLFGIIGWLVDVIAIFLCALWTISTLGLALLIIIPLWIVGFLIIPAIALSAMAGLMPSHLSIHGWWPSFEGGLVMLVIGAICSSPKKKKED